MPELAEGCLSKMSGTMMREVMDETTEVRNPAIVHSLMPLTAAAEVAAQLYRAVSRPLRER